MQSHKSLNKYKVVEQLYLEKAGWREAPALATLAALVNSILIGITSTSLLYLSIALHILYYNVLFTQIAGLVLGLVAFLGCCGAITASK